MFDDTFIRHIISEANNQRPHLKHRSFLFTMTLFLTCPHCHHQRFTEIETVIEVTQRLYIVGEDGKLESIEENNVTFERQSTLLCDNCKRVIKQ